MEGYKNKIAVIMSLAIEVTAKTKADVFVRYYGNADVLAVDIHTSGWKKDHTPEKHYEAYNWQSDKELKDTIDDITRTLVYLLETEEQK